MKPTSGADTGGVAAGVVVVGSITADVTAFSQRLPHRGETVLGDDFTLVLGGKGANQAVAGALAGAPSYLVGCVGDDLFKNLVFDGLLRHKVNIDHIRIVEGATGVAHIRVDASGENDIVITPLANSRLTGHQVETAISALAGRVSVMLTQLEIPLETCMAAIRCGKESGLTVLLDPAPAQHLDDAIWPFVDIVTPNETEASLITGIPVVDEATAIDAGRWFCARGVRHAVVTLASAGAVLVTGREAVRFNAFAVDVVDTTAAGDAFAGYLGAALAGGDA
ncbi:MAG TPA: ribokinase, partial [Micrococcaceae bacterium]